MQRPLELVPKVAFKGEQDINHGNFYYHPKQTLTHVGFHESLFINAITKYSKVQFAILT